MSKNPIIISKPAAPEIVKYKSLSKRPANSHKMLFNIRMPTNTIVSFSKKTNHTLSDIPSNMKAAIIKVKGISAERNG